MIVVIVDVVFLIDVIVIVVVIIFLIDVVVIVVVFVVIMETRWPFHVFSRLFTSFHVSPRLFLPGFFFLNAKEEKEEISWNLN